MPDLYQKSKHQFITKIYSVLMAQLIFTSIAVALVMYFPEIGKFQSDQPVLLGLCTLATFVVVITLGNNAKILSLCVRSKSIIPD